MIDFNRQYAERQHTLDTLLALIENPACSRGIQMWLQNKMETRSPIWYPRASFLRWARDEDKLSALFNLPVHFVDASHRSLDNISELKNGEAVFNQELRLSLQGRSFSLYPDLILKKDEALHVLEFCCHPYRGGHTSSHVLRKARLKTALFQHLLPIESRPLYASLIFHRWNTLHLLTETVSYEQRQIGEALSLLRNFSIDDSKAHSFHLQNRCRFTCLKHPSCEQEAIQNGLTDAFSYRLPNLLGNTTIPRASQLLAGESEPTSPHEQHLRGRLQSLSSLHEQLFGKGTDPQ